MKFNNKQNEIIRDSNGKIHWISRSVAVVITIILNNNKVLLVKRGKNISSSGKWCNPCGYLDWNENAIECAYREVWEETGLDLKKIMEDNNIKSSSMMLPWDIVTDPKLNYNQDIAFHFGVNLTLNSIPLLTNGNSEDNEIDDVKWINIDELNDYHLAFNHDDRIQKYINYINSIS